MLAIAMVQTGGGEGKTSLLRGMAYSKQFKDRFKSIGIVEIDEQGDTVEFIADRGEKIKKDKVNFLSLASVDKSDYKEELIKFFKANEIVLIDCPGEGTIDASQLAIDLSDLVLIPNRTSRKARRLFQRNIYPAISADAQENPGKYHIIPTFVHPQTGKASIKDYFNAVLPEGINSLNSVFYFRSVYENFEEFGLTLLEYARSVKTNKRQFEQAKKAVLDMERISKEVLSFI
jgi:cellulose biosynthesis protein BcsQ